MWLHTLCLTLIVLASSSPYVLSATTQKNQTTLRRSATATRGWADNVQTISAILSIVDFGSQYVGLTSLPFFSGDSTVHKDLIRIVNNTPLILDFWGSNQGANMAFGEALIPPGASGSFCFRISATPTTYQTFMVLAYWDYISGGIDVETITLSLSSSKAGAMAIAGWINSHAVTVPTTVASWTMSSYRTTVKGKYLQSSQHTSPTTYEVNFDVLQLYDTSLNVASWILYVTNIA